jgi:hypothetical protein
MRRPVEEFQLPFVMELARSHKMRLELQFKGQTAVQVFDGTQGWKVRPFLNRSEVEPFSVEEMKLAAMQADLDGHLVDYAAKGTRLELVGMEKVEDRDTYKLRLTLRSGQAFHVWIDAQTFLETKMEGQPHRMDGVYHPAEVYFRDYREVNGLQVPFVLETRVLPVGRTALGVKDAPVPAEKITIEKVVVNPKLDESVFAKPQLLAAASVPAVHAGKEPVRCLALLAWGLFLAPALVRADGPGPDARSLAVAEAVLGYCTKTVPSVAAQQRQRIERLTHDASRQSLTELRKSPEYRQAYDAETDFIAKVTEHNARRLCSESLARNK